MTIIEVLHQLKARKSWSKDGEKESVEFSGGITDEAVQELKELNFSSSAVWPKEYRELLLACERIDCEYDICFSGQGGQSADFLSSDEWHFATDGFGNSWAIFLPSVESDIARVYYCCHDPAVIICQSQSVAEFLIHFGNCFDPMTLPSLSDVESNVCLRVFRDNLGRIPVSEARESSDQAIADFASSLPDDYWFYDFRSPKNGDGFTWSYGKGPVPTCKQMEDGWLVGIPPGASKNPGSGEKKSFLQKLFGR